MALYNLREKELPWAQDLPSSWEVKPLYSFCELRQGKAHEPFVDESGDYICVNSRFISTEGKKVKHCTKKLTEARLNDILMVMSDLPNGRALAKGYFVDSDPEIFAVNQRVCAITVQGANPKFLYYQMSRSPYFIQFDDGVNQTHLSNYAYLRYPALLPDLETQNAIVSFLDKKIVRVDGLIEEKQNFIDLLKEKRQALISHFVTKGLDANVPMKDSGVEWIGEVPEHWSDMKLAWAIKISSGENLDNSLFEKDKSGSKVIPVIGGNGVTGYTDKVNNDGLTLVIGRVGAHCGNVRVIDYPSWITDNALRATIDEEKITYAYLAHLLVAANLNDMANKSAQPLITGGQVKSLRFPIPPVKEQLEIVSSITSKNRTIDSLISETVSSISLLKEHRTALISAAVTGKIDVRGMVDTKEGAA
jgi:type I restriction enzyme S subunit